MAPTGSDTAEHSETELLFPALRPDPQRQCQATSAISANLQATHHDLIARCKRHVRGATRVSRPLNLSFRTTPRPVHYPKTSPKAALSEGHPSWIRTPRVAFLHCSHNRNTPGALSSNHGLVRCNGLNPNKRWACEASSGKYLARTASTTLLHQ